MNIKEDLIFLARKFISIFIVKGTKMREKERERGRDK